MSKIQFQKNIKKSKNTKQNNLDESCQIISNSIDIEMIEKEIEYEEKLW